MDDESRGLKREPEGAALEERTDIKVGSVGAATSEAAAAISQGGPCCRLGLQLITSTRVPFVTDSPPSPCSSVLQKRNRRIFGSLLGTLAQFKAAEEGSANLEVSKRRAALLQKAEQRSSNASRLARETLLRQQEDAR